MAWRASGIRPHLASVFPAIVASLDDKPLPVVHQPIDRGGGQGVVHVKDFVPVTERAVGGWRDRSGLMAGSDDLEHQVLTAVVDR